MLIRLFRTQPRKGAPIASFPPSVIHGLDEFSFCSLRTKRHEIEIITFPEKGTINSGRRPELSPLCYNGKIDSKRDGICLLLLLA